MGKGKHNNRKNKHSMAEMKTKMMHTPGGYCYPLKTVDKTWLQNSPFWRSTIVVSGFSRQNQDIRKIYSTSQPMVGISISQTGIGTKSQEHTTQGNTTRNLQNRRNARGCNSPKTAVSYEKIDHVGADIGAPPQEKDWFWTMKSPNDRLRLICMDGGSFSLELDENKAAPLVTVRNLRNSYIILAAFTLCDKLKKEIQCNGNEDVEAFQKSKNSVIKTDGSQHQQSSGEYYSFGLKGSYAKAVNGVSIGVYKGTYTSNQKTRLIQHKIDRAMKIGQETFDHFMPGLWASAFIVLHDIANVAREKHILKKGDRNKKVLNDTHGVLCVNATTKLPHNEMDGSYTAGIVPQQLKDNVNEYYFLFHLTASISIRLPMKPGVVFLYNAYLLTHQQICTKQSVDCYFQNYTRYCSKRLMQTAGATMYRDHLKKQKKELEDKENIQNFDCK